ncbi:threonine ammonia-lyase, biosynthetic [Geoalkalibacter halelectricus]|uniref:L-threonine dehydratase n=1 Tax=Geoalkalibacter halelectricus TaxID=2847045 RepID=A0ABY5ZHM7_9BACT|nr:threonine ammonia-lyase, biosynthetic [Geoalkalibacter halelectricus]MDO3379491.1 threonine ammonia-lyase, biosynthetic [Geoalkalibacter halelectricus]UWZ78083.1 threonine ammonia-lyase, biosynthetic [Geoalkalibacter halelectricus]
MQKMLKLILTSRVYDAAIETPLDEAPALSAALGNRVLLKREDLQPVFSFKLRGAYNRMAHLTGEERRRGVIAASAGNHAQGVAYSARMLDIPATIVMPATTPQIKVEAVSSYGARILLHGDNYSEAAEHCARLVDETGMVFIPPFDDELVIAGQGTVADELLRQSAGKLDAVFVPVGGGGLIAGMAAYLKALRPDVRIIGVEPLDSDAMARSLEAGRRVTLESVGIFADGVAVREVGRLTFELCRKYVDEIVRVDTDELCSAIKSVYQATRSIVEPAGALGLAGLKKYVRRNKVQGQTLVAINSGANMNFDRLRYVAERTLVGEKKEALFAVTIPEQPGSLKRFCQDMVAGRNITEFNYRLSRRDHAHIFVGITVRDEEERLAFGRHMNDAGFANIDLTDNELAKTHIRYMVGGRSTTAGRELLYRFWFPERPGALGRFLDAMGTNWNISLFHYRTQGGEFGRVLIGLEIPAGDDENFQQFLGNLGYRYQDETANPAYRLFL